MPNHYCNHLVLWASYDEGGRARLEDLDDEAWAAWVMSRPLNRLRPEPDDIKHPNPQYMSDESMMWRRANWGTKWDLYGPSSVLPMQGDFSNKVVEFETAWGPPNDSMRRLLARDICDRFGCQRVIWFGFDPFDDSVGLLMDYRAERVVDPQNLQSDLQGLGGNPDE